MRLPALAAVALAVLCACGQREAPAPGSAPRYAARTVVTEDFLATEFNLPPESLKPVEKRPELTVVQVGCGDVAWTAFGSLLIAIGPDRALTPWDGVFFELERTAAPPG